MVRWEEKDLKKNDFGKGMPPPYLPKPTPPATPATACYWQKDLKTGKWYRVYPPGMEENPFRVPRLPPSQEREGR